MPKRDGGLYSREDLYTYIARTSAVTQVDTKIWCDMIFNAIRMAIKEGRDVRLPYLGSFEQKDVAERKYWSVLDNDFRIKPAHRKVNFKVNEILKSQIEKLPTIADELELYEEDEAFEPEN